jgi:hypothetical protein
MHEALASIPSTRKRGKEGGEGEEERRKKGNRNLKKREKN